VGLPRFPFADFILPADAQNNFAIRNSTVSVGLDAKLAAATKGLREAGFDMVTQEWPTVPSAAFGRPVNAVLEALYAPRIINDLPYDGLGTAGLLPFTGAMAEWIKTYLEADYSIKVPFSHI
jgi:hypothetical protein